MAYRTRYAQAQRRVELTQDRSRALWAVTLIRCRGKELIRALQEYLL